MNKLCLEDRPVVRTGEDARLLDLGDGIGCVQFLSKGNSVTPTVREFLRDVVENGLYNFDGLVIANAGKHYSVGANLASMKEQIDRGDFSSFRERGLQKTVTRMKYSKKPVVAAPYRMTLGGGLEIVLHTHKRVALQKSFLGLVEAGVGLIPGGGGTKETALQIGRTSSELRDKVLKDSYRKLLMRQVSKDAQDAAVLGYLSETDWICGDAEDMLTQAKACCMELVGQGFVPKEPGQVTLPGRQGYQMLMDETARMLEEGAITPYDAEIGRHLAVVLCGSADREEVVCSEEELMQMENDCFVELTKSKGTYERISYFLEHNDLLRN